MCDNQSGDKNYRELALGMIVKADDDISYLKNKDFFHITEFYVSNNSDLVINYHNDNLNPFGNSYRRYAIQVRSNPSGALTFYYDDSSDITTIPNTLFYTTPNRPIKIATWNDVENDIAVINIYDGNTFLFSQRIDMADKPLFGTRSITAAEYYQNTTQHPTYLFNHKFSATQYPQFGTSNTTYCSYNRYINNTIIVFTTDSFHGTQDYSLFNTTNIVVSEYFINPFIEGGVGSIIELGGYGDRIRWGVLLGIVISLAAALMIGGMTAFYGVLAAVFFTSFVLVYFGLLFVWFIIIDAFIFGFFMAKITVWGDT